MKTAPARFIPAYYTLPRTICLCFFFFPFGTAANEQGSGTRVDARSFGEELRAAWHREMFSAFVNVHRFCGGVHAIPLWANFGLTRGSDRAPPLYATERHSGRRGHGLTVTLARCTAFLQSRMLHNSGASHSPTTPLTPCLPLHAPRFDCLCQNWRLCEASRTVGFSFGFKGSAESAPRTQLL